MERNVHDLRFIELFREVVVPKRLNETLKRGICDFFLFVSQKNRSGFQMTVDIAITCATNGQKNGCSRRNCGSNSKTYRRSSSLYF